MLRQFRDFAMRGNVLDLAVAVVMGAAFGGVVTSFTNDILMPPIGLLLGQVDFSNLFLNLSSTPVASVAEAKEKGIATLNYGVFLNTVINFVIVGFAVFLLVRWVNRFARKPAAAPAPPTKECPYCFSAIPLKATRCPHCTSEVRSAA
jgi:large conductance mechanosensitive channel